MPKSHSLNPSAHDVQDHEERSLISPFWDLALVGGVSLVFFVLANVFFRADAPPDNVAWFVFNLSYIINFPHFLVSYQMLYGDFRAHIFKDLRFFWAAVVVPVILATVLIAAFTVRSPQTLGYLVNAMFFFVGWHYVKQIFGCISVGNSLNRYFYSPVERFALKANLFSLWAISFLAQNQAIQNFQMEGVSYRSFELPHQLLTLAFIATFITGAAVAALHIRRFIQDGRWPSRTAMMAFGTIYIWYIPALYHPYFLLMIPLFHSMQYLMFVYAFRRNKVAMTVENHASPQFRKKWVFGVLGYFGLAALTGALAFRILPQFTDSFQLTDPALFGPTAAIFSATIFINVHHYFIDNVLWRAKNPEMKKYLFAKPQTPLKKAVASKPEQNVA